MNRLQRSVQATGQPQGTPAEAVAERDESLSLRGRVVATNRVQETVQTVLMQNDESASGFYFGDRMGSELEPGWYGTLMTFETHPNSGRDEFLRKEPWIGPFATRVDARLAVERPHADDLTRTHSGFEGFQALLDAKGGFRPSIDLRQPGLRWLADAYDAAQEARGDERRAFRYGNKKGTPVEEGLGYQPVPESAPAGPVQAPEKKTTLRGPGGIHLVLDPQDPDTPGMVYSSFWKHSASYGTASEFGELEPLKGEDAFELSEAQTQWLEAQGALFEATERVAKGRIRG